MRPRWETRNSVKMLSEDLVPPFEFMNERLLTSTFFYYHYLSPHPFPLTTDTSLYSLDTRVEARLSTLGEGVVRLPPTSVRVLHGRVAHLR